MTRDHRSFDVEVQDDRETAIVQAADLFVIVVPGWRRVQAKETDPPSFVKTSTWYELISWSSWVDYGDVGGSTGESGDSLFFVTALVLRRLMQETDWGMTFASRLPASLLGAVIEDQQEPKVQHQDSWRGKIASLFSRYKPEFSAEQSWDEKQEEAKRIWHGYENIARYALSHAEELVIVFLTRDERYGPYRLVQQEDCEGYRSPF